MDNFIISSSNCDINFAHQENIATITLGNRDYWMRCNINVAYNNSAGHSPSANVSLRGPYESMILNYSLSLFMLYYCLGELQELQFNAAKMNSSSLKLSWTVGDIMRLFSNRSYIDKKFTLVAAPIINGNPAEQQKLITVDINQQSTVLSVTTTASKYYVGANITVNVNGTSYYPFNTTVTLMDSTVVPSTVVPPTGNLL